MTEGPKPYQSPQIVMGVLLFVFLGVVVFKRPLGIEDSLATLLEQLLFAAFTFVLAAVHKKIPATYSGRVLIRWQFLLVMAAVFLFGALYNYFTGNPQ